MSKIEPHDHPDFVGGIVWSRIEITWIEERLQQAVAEAKASVLGKTPMDIIDEHVAEATAEINELRDVLRRIKDILAEAGHPLCNENGNLIREALKQLVEERDQLAAQAAEIAELRAYNQTRTDELAASVRQCAELRAEIAELRKDAERYRFARSRAYVAVNPYYQSCLWTLRGVLEVNYNAAETHGFDAAIDAERSKE